MAARLARERLDEELVPLAARRRVAELIARHEREGRLLASHHLARVRVRVVVVVVVGVAVVVGVLVGVVVGVSPPRAGRPCARRKGWWDPS